MPADKISDQSFMKKLIIIRGPLGVGKTTVSLILAQKLQAKYISVDQILDDNKLVAPDANGIPLESYLKANEIILDMADESKNSLIVDGCFYYQDQIDDLKNKFDNDVIIFTLVSDVEKCIARDSKRPKIYGEDSTRYVHMLTTKFKAGYEIDSSNLTVEETVGKIINSIL